MSDRSRIVFRAWRSDFLRRKEWMDFPPKRSSIPSSLAENIHANIRLQRDLSGLCKRFGIDPKKEIEIWDDSSASPFPRANCGTLPTAVAASVLDAIAATKNWEMEAARITLSFKKIRDKSPKSGKVRAMPAFVAAWILLGFELQRRNASGIALMRDFLRPNGDFSRWLEENFGECDLRRQLAASKSIHLFQVYLRKVYLSRDRPKIIRKLSDVSSGERENLEKDLKNASRKILTKVLKRTNRPTT